MRIRLGIAIVMTLGMNSMVTKPPVLYLSGPMTNIPGKNYWQFRSNSVLLRTAGYSVVNPWELDEEDRRATWEECLRRDIIEMMQKCSGIATLRGWKKSRGACLEVEIAKRLGWPIHTVSYWRNKCHILRHQK